MHILIFCPCLHWCWALGLSGWPCRESLSSTLGMSQSLGPELRAGWGLAQAKSRAGKSSRPVSWGAPWKLTHSDTAGVAWGLKSAPSVMRLLRSLSLGV